jgi:hypothetical protein
LSVSPASTRFAWGIVLTLALALALSPAADAKRRHGKAMNDRSVSVRFKAKKAKGRPETLLGLTPRSKPRRRIDVVLPPCIHYLIPTGEGVTFCQARGGPITSCRIDTPAAIRPCPGGIPPYPPPIPF